MTPGIDTRKWSFLWQKATKRSVLPCSWYRNDAVTNHVYDDFILHVRTVLFFFCLFFCLFFFLILLYQSPISTLTLPTIPLTTASFPLYYSSCLLFFPADPILTLTQLKIYVNTIRDKVRWLEFVTPVHEYALVSLFACQWKINWASGRPTWWLRTRRNKNAAE